MSSMENACSRAGCQQEITVHLSSLGITSLSHCNYLNDGEASSCSRVGTKLGVVEGATAEGRAKDNSRPPFSAPRRWFFVVKRYSIFVRFGMTTVPSSVTKNRRRSCSRSMPMTACGGISTSLSMTARLIRA